MCFFFFQAEDGIRDLTVTGVQTCALPIWSALMALGDTSGRQLRSLRISVTDWCNLRCAYCMPEEDYVWLPRAEILHFGEVAALVDVFMDLGVDKIRLTGGEPLLRRELPRLVRMLAAKPRL